MARQLFIGLITEGPTDVRFLQSVGKGLLLMWLLNARMI